MVYLMVLLAVLARFLPHVWNFSPVYGALLFGGAQLKKRDSLWFPLVLLAASDYVLTNLMYHLNLGWQELIQIAAFASIAMIGWALRERSSLRRFSFACLAGATAFYLISNFGVWLGWHTYPPTLAGLVACYVAALPFYGYTLGSTVLFAGILFGTYRFYESRRTQTAEVASGLANR
ncbi:MAG TPA: DUF6580 family putative transport protein [Verrucomicrobiae bacterium]|jgi:hypothetical protein|nr:DUF6580 family putative transport protein [Verrucomicrobiae bacterium]